jgi:nucleoside-diphosphate-sugar epimerase
MRVLVTGGVTGYLGQFVVNALQGSHEVQLLLSRVYPSVGILEMHASRMFLCMRKSSCMDECDWPRLVNQHIVRTYKTY